MHSTHNHHLHHHYLHFFANTEMVEMFFFQLFKSIAFGLVGIFIPMYFYQAGIPLYQILGIFTIISIFHGLFALLFNRFLIFKFGLKHTFIISLILYSISFLILHQGISPLLIILFILTTALAEAIYWGTHHSYVVLSMDIKDAGKEVALLEIIGQIASIITPFAGALLIILFGYSPMFIVACILIVISVFPLFLTKEKNISKQQNLPGLSHLRKTWGNKRQVSISTIAKGVDSSLNPLWGLYVFFLLGGLNLFGGLISFLSFINILISYIAGKRSDDRQSTFRLGINSSIAARAIAAGAFIPHIAVLSDVLSSLTDPLYYNPRMSQIYKKCHDQYAISYMTAHETLWHIGNTIAMIIITIGTYFFGWYAFLISIFIMLIGKFIIRSQRVGE